MRKISAAFILVLVITQFAFAADVNYPYVNIRLKLPPSDDPLPGMGNYYTTLSQGMKSALWNPASLGKLKLSDASVSMISGLETYNFQKSFKLNEMSGSMEGGTYAIFYRYPQVIGSGTNTKEVELMANGSYATSSTGANFSSALKVNDWLSVGFSSGNPVETNLELAGDFPLTARANANAYGQQMGEMQITNDGKFRYTFTSGGGTVATYESIQKIWGGFLSQEATIPLTNISELRNNIQISSPYMGTLASNFGKFYLGLNLIPINASADINNDVRTVVNADTQDIFLYVPNFDAQNESELANWINDPDKYGAADGYKRKLLKLPAGEIIATTRYRGFYTASTARFDLGTMYDVNDWLSVGLVFENLGGSSLNFKGNGLASYINYREINTTEASSLQDLLQPGGKSSLDFVSDRWITTFEAGGTKLYLEPEKLYELPKKIRFGVLTRRPFLIALDYEQNQVPIRYLTTENNLPKEIIIRNLNFLRIGTDLSLLRGGLTLLFKPTVTGADQKTQDSINNAFKYGVLPLRLDLGGALNLWGYEVGGSFGINVLPIFGVLQLDTANLDLTKMVFYSTTLRKDAWQITYLSQFDPLSTAAAYNNKTVASGQTKKFEFSDVRYVHTLGVTYRF